MRQKVLLLPHAVVRWDDSITNKSIAWGWIDKYAELLDKLCKG
jgi:hypothetical protein